MSRLFAHLDPEFEAWYAGDITTLELADHWLPSMVLPDEDEDASAFDALAWAWRYLSDELTAVGFEADDFGTFLECVVPRLPSSAFVPPPELATDLTAPRNPSPVARVYLDVDGAFSPLCPQRDESELLAEMRGPRLSLDPPIGWVDAARVSTRKAP